MRYEGAELLDLLAGEYVLGTLRGPARRRFERVCASNTPARTALEHWEDDWSGLSLSLAPVEPSAAVWAGVEQRLFGAGSPRSSVRPLRQRAWRMAIAATLVALALVIGLYVREQQHGPLQTLALLGPDAAHSVWRVERARELTSLTIRVVGRVQRIPGKGYELWALPRGGNPVSLGLLPEGGTLERRLTDPQRMALLTADKVAVSIEPGGGSPTGGPTGPIVIVANLQPFG